MHTSRKSLRALMAIAALLLLAPAAAFAADPGVPFLATSEISDQKQGSILIYNLYTSTPAAPAVQNTRFNITNTSDTSAAFVHLFFVDGNSCSVSDRYICLTANQTMTFLASEQDPGTTGYLVAISVDGNTGCPNNFNYLVGDEYVKLESGHFANLGAEAIAAQFTTATVPGCDANSTTAAVAFNGAATGYNRIPTVLAISNIGSRADGNETLLVINRIGGDLSVGAFTISAIFGILYDDAEQPHSYTFSSGCQRFSQITDTLPRTSPRVSVVIPAGQTGWTKFWPVSGQGILGSVIVRNANAGTNAGAFNSGHNLHKLKLSNIALYVVPVFAPGC